MSSTIAQLLPLALAAALTPTAVLAVILLQFSSRGRRKGAAFLAGWYFGLLILSWLILTLLVRLGFFSSFVGGYSVPAGMITLLGLLLLLFAVQQWRTRPNPGTSVAPPAWFDLVDSLGPRHAFGIGAALASLTPKMILLTLMAAVVIGRSSPAPGETLAADVFYATLGSVLVAIPVALHFLRGQRAQVMFLRWKDWLLRNNNAVMAIVSLLMGLALLVSGLAGLLA